MLRMLIVDDHAVVRDGLKRMFDDPTGTTVFGEASNVPDTISLVREHDWDIVVLDISLGDRSGLQLLQDLNQLRPQLPVLILSMHGEEQFARRALKAGASGYITKDSPRAELVKAIHKVIGGGKYVSVDLAEKLIVNLTSDTDRPLHDGLSNREFEVMCLIASGKTGTDIANILCLSDSTISTYRARILEKMGMNNNAELTHYAIKNGLID